MRITSQILTRTSLETGIPIAQNGILDAMSNQNTAVDLLEVMERKQNTEKLSKLKEQYRELEEAADNLGRNTSKLLDDGDNSLFHKAQEQNDTKDIVTEIRNMVTSYNETLELLQDADGSLNHFYYKELRDTVTNNEELLKSAGVTQSEDGSLNLGEKVLESVDYDTLKKVFGSESDFTKRVDYISGRVAENASVNVASTSNQYNAKGYSYNSSFEVSKYDYLG